MIVTEYMENGSLDQYLKVRCAAVPLKQVQTSLEFQIFSCTENHSNCVEF